MLIYHDGKWNQDELQRLIDGKHLDRNGKRYSLCLNCNRVIRIDTPLIGSLHLCDNEPTGDSANEE